LVVLTGDRSMEVEKAEKPIHYRSSKNL